MKNKNTVLVIKTITSFLFILVVFVLIVALSADGEFKWAEINERWWVLRVMQVLFFFLVYLNIYDTLFDFLRNNIYGNIWPACQTLLLRIEYVQKNKLRRALEDAVKQRNHDYFVSASTALLHSACAWIDYDEIDRRYAAEGEETGGWDRITEQDIKDICEKALLRKGAAKKLQKAILCVKQGRVAYEFVTSDNLINRNAIDFQRHDATGKKFSNRVIGSHIYNFISGAFKVFLFTAFVIYNVSVSGLLNGLLSSCIILFGGASSGSIQAWMNGEYLLSIATANNAFYLQYMGISIVSELPVAPPSKRKKKETPKYGEDREEEELEIL